MKILILNWRDVKHPLGGGAEIMTQRMAAGWVKAGHQVTQFSSLFPGAKKEEVVEGVKIIRQGSHFTVHLCFWLSWFRGRLGGVDLIVDEIHFLPFFTPLLAPGVKRVALIFELAREVWFQNIFPPLALIGFLAEPFFFLFYRRTQFITDSQSTKKDLSSWGIKRSQIKVIEPGIDLQPLDRPKKKEKEPTFLYLGALVKDKGIEAAITAFGLISQKLPKAKFWVAGKGVGMMVAKLKKQASELGLTKKITFFGFVSEKKKIELLQKAHLVINPSDREGWGIVVIEANSQGTPVVGYDVVGLRDSIQNKKTGRLVRKNDITGLAKTAIWLLNDKSRYRRYQKEALIWADHFDWKRVVDQSLTVVEGV